MTEERDERTRAYVRRYGDALAAHQPARTVALYGFPCMMLTDSFVGTLSAPDQLETALTQATEAYAALDMRRVAGDVGEITWLTDRLVRVRVRWSFFDADDAFLADSEYEYVLRDEDAGLRCYAVLSFDEDRKLRELLASRAGRRATQDPAE